MAPTLFIISASPPARAVLLCTKALGIEVNVKQVDIINGEQLKEEYIKLNPTGTIPILVEDDGFSLWDSHAIMTYLVGKYGKNDSLYPTDLRKRAKVDEKLHFDNSTLFTRGLAISRPVVFDGKTDVPPLELKKLQRAFEIVENSFLKNSQYIAGDDLTVADFSYVTSLDSWAVFEPITKSKYPKISAYVKRMESLPYYMDANRAGRENYYALIKSKLNL